jgi:hypothetical protein
MRCNPFQIIGCFLVLLLVSGCGGSSAPDDSCDNETGTCEQVCGGLPLPEVSTACAADQICERPADSCRIADLPGVCVDKPEACAEIYQPVCGCDGQTYGNDCERLQAGAGLDFSGACDELCPIVDCLPGSRPVDTNGDGCESTCEEAYDVPCSGEEDCWWQDNLYCKRPEGTCGIVDGICTTKTEGCTSDYNPVCGCDGATYSNRCDAAIAGVSVESSGPCEKICGGYPEPGSGEPAGCATGQVCDIWADACEIPDTPGTCVRLPTACPRIYDPVCGCDNQTYDNDCLRIQAGAQLQYAFSCAVPTQ